MLSQVFKLSKSQSFTRALYENHNAFVNIADTAEHAVNVPLLNGPTAVGVYLFNRSTSAHDQPCDVRIRLRHPTPAFDANTPKRDIFYEASLVPASNSEGVLITPIPSAGTVAGGIVQRSCPALLYIPSGYNIDVILQAQTAPSGSGGVGMVVTGYY